MIQYYLDLENQVKNISEKTLAQGQIQKLYSTAYFISIAIRSPGKTWHIYFGRGGGYEGVWLGEAPPVSSLRRKDNFLEYLRSHLSSCSFLELDLDRSDRIVALHYQKYGERQSFIWFWRGRKLYFLHYYQEKPEGPHKLLLSWRGKAFQPGPDVNLNLFEYFDEVGRQGEMAHDLSSTVKPIAEILDEELKAASLKKIAKPNFLQRKKANIEEDLRKTRQWEKLQSILEKDSPLEGLYELKVEDQKIKFEGDLNAFERRNLLFQKIKKLKKGESILSERLNSIEKEIQGKSQVESQTSTIPIIKPVWGDEAPKVREKVKTQVEDYKIFHFEGFQIGVGHSAQGNDQLRSKWASREDHWVHLDGLKSAHGILKIDHGAITPEILNTAATIVAHFSHFSDEWIPIIHTQVKNVKGVTGAPGMVTYKKEKHLRCPRVDVEDVLKE